MSLQQQDNTNRLVQSNGAWNAAATLVVSAKDREQLARLIRAFRASKKMVLRARIMTRHVRTEAAPVG